MMAVPPVKKEERERRKKSSHRRQSIGVLDEKQFFVEQVNLLHDDILLVMSVSKCFCWPTRSRSRRALKECSSDDFSPCSFYTAAEDDQRSDETSSFSNYERRGTFYGIRERISTRVDILRHPSGEWWSDARLDAPHVVEDLGDDPRILARTIKVRVIERDEKSSDELGSYFFDIGKKLRSSRRYLIVQLLLGNKIVVSISETFDVDTFDRVYNEDDLGALANRLKFIVNPANVHIPWSIYGPKESSSIVEFFGEGNCSIRRKTTNVDHVVITIDVYSKFLIRSFLPKLAFQPGRICDYMICDYDNRLIHTGFRLVGTETLLNLMKKKPKPK